MAMLVLKNKLSRFLACIAATLLCGVIFTQIPVFADTPKNEAVLHTDINTTKYGQREHLEYINGNDYFSWGRIDVADNHGYHYQAMVYICHGSESFTKQYDLFLEKLSVAYSEDYGNIAGYLDLVRDNRTRNFGTGNFFDVKNVSITNINGVEYDAIVIAISGTSDFCKNYYELKADYLDEYIELIKFH